ncbi:MAG: hypothetical protein KAJ34_04760 [Thermodesulfovibrionia bacterium]|nr:hypothetical protein [Thermodesulfovibrionia bacterium]
MSYTGLFLQFTISKFRCQTKISPRSHDEITITKSSIVLTGIDSRNFGTTVRPVPGNRTDGPMDMPGLFRYWCLIA